MPLEAGAVELMTLQTSLGTEAREDKIWNDAQLTSRRNGHQHVQIPLLPWKLVCPRQNVHCLYFHCKCSPPGGKHKRGQLALLTKSRSELRNTMAKSFCFSWSGEGKVCSRNGISHLCILEDLLRNFPLFLLKSGNHKEKCTHCNHTQSSFFLVRTVEATHASAQDKVCFVRDAISFISPEDLWRSSKPVPFLYRLYR